MAWIYDIYCRTGIRVPFPVIADRSGEIARKYGMIANDISSTQTVRNVFIIDDNGVVRLILVYPLNVGRCIPEILRCIEALQIADCNKASTPANWIPNQPIVMSPPTTINELDNRVETLSKEKNGFSWYLNFKESSKECDKLIDKNIKK